MKSYVGDPVEVADLIERLMNRAGFGFHLGREKRSKGANFTIEFAYFADGGSDYQDGFVTIQDALKYAVDKADEYDEAEKS